MTANRPPSQESLNAYIDGELSAAEAAAVAQALATDRSLARTIATLSRLKAAVQEVVEPVDLAIPAPKTRPWRRLGLAACVVGAMVLTATALLAPWRAAPPPELVVQAWSIHDAWTHAGDRPPPPRVSSGLVLATWSRLGPGAHLPDLSAARLSLSRMAPISLSAPSGEAVHLGYRGTRGCQVSLLIISEGDGLPGSLAAFSEGARRGYAWRTDTHGYVLMAEGMDKDRLALLARFVHATSTEQTPFDEAMRSALRDSRERSAPCQA